MILLTLDEETLEMLGYASEAIGVSRVEAYFRELATRADEYESNPDWGNSVALVEMYDADRIALTILSALDMAKIRAYEDWARAGYLKSEAYTYEEAYPQVMTLEPAEWTEANWALIWVDNRGFAGWEVFGSEEPARQGYEEACRDEFPSDEEDEDEEPAICGLCKGPHETPEAWGDECERFAPFLGEVRRAETWGGLE